MLRTRGTAGAKGNAAITPETPTIQSFASDLIGHSVNPLAVDWIQLILAGALTIGLTTAVALVIRVPLLGMLQLVTGSEVGAAFWTTFAMVLIVMGPLFLVFTAAAGADSLADFVRRTVYLVSIGIIGAFMVLGAAMMFSQPSRAFERRRVAMLDADTRRVANGDVEVHRARAAE